MRHTLLVLASIIALLLCSRDDGRAAAFTVNVLPPQHFSRATVSTFSSCLSAAVSSGPFDSTYNIYEVVSRKETEIEHFVKMHSSPSDPLRLRLGYMSTNSDMSRKKVLARAFRRSLTSPPRLSPSMFRSEADLPPHPHNNYYLSVGVDVKRRSPTAPNAQRGSAGLADFTDSGPVSAALVGLGADFVFCNVDSHSYGGSVSDLKSTVSSLKAFGSSSVSGVAPPVIMKDIVIHPMQLALASESGCDAALLLACVLGSDLSDFLNAGTSMDLPCLVEVHTEEELALALDAGATYLLVNRCDRVNGNRLYKEQAFRLAKSFPPSGFVTILATGDIQTAEEAGDFLDAGYDGVVLGKAIMGNDKAGELIKGVREVTGGSGKWIRPGFNY